MYAVYVCRCELVWMCFTCLIVYTKNISDHALFVWKLSWRQTHFPSLSPRPQWSVLKSQTLLEMSRPLHEPPLGPSVFVLTRPLPPLSTWSSYEVFKTSLSPQLFQFPAFPKRAAFSIQPSWLHGIVCTCVCKCVCVCVCVCILLVFF